MYELLQHVRKSQQNLPVKKIIDFDLFYLKVID